MENFEGKIILDISSSVTGVDHEHLDFGQSQDESCEPLESTLEEQKLVNKFLDGELNFNDYIENFSYSAVPDELEIFSSEDKPSLENLGKRDQLAAVPMSRAKKSARKLPPALKGLMGEANLRLARGDKDTAVKICLEIIRQVPTAAEPFLTLAGIYDELGDQEKFLQMSLVAAHLSPTDLYQWVNLAELSEKQGLIKQAISCYTKAINLDLQNMDLHKKRAVLLESIGDKKTSVRGYFRLLSSLPPSQADQVLSLSKFIAEICHKENDIVKASEALDLALQKCPFSADMEIVNLQLELLLQMKKYGSCLEVLVRFCGLEYEAEGSHGDDSFMILNCTVPQSIPIDILTKIIVVLIHMKAVHLVDKVINPLEQISLSASGDLYLDIIDAYVEEGFNIEANILLHKLVSSEEYGLPGVWLKHAENLKNLGKFDEATSAYYTVLEQAPQHFEARLTLSSLLVQLRRHEEAIKVLTQNEEYDQLDVGLLYERCLLLQKDPNRERELIMVAQLLFSRHCIQIRNKDELTTISTIQRYDKKRIAVKTVRKTKKESEFDEGVPIFLNSSKGPTVEDEWELFKYVCTLCIKLKMYVTFQRLTFTAQLSTIFHVYKFEIDLLSIISAYFNKDSHNGYNIVRTLVGKNHSNVKLWLLFNLIITKSDDARHNRFIMRQLARNCDHPALGQLHGNNCLVAGTYKYAMHEYSIAYEKNPTALGALLLGLTYLQMAAQKFTSKKHQLVIQALGLLAQYQEHRGPFGLQEVHYNLGRGFHHLGLFSSAIYHYKKVFEYSSLPLAKQQPEIFDLSREAAFNLHLIYCQSESYNLARMYIDKYIVI